MKKIPLIFACLLLLAAAMSCALAEGAGTAAFKPIDLTDLISSAVLFVLALITRRLLPWLKGKASAQQLQLLEAAIDTAVYAAQQLFKTKTIDDRLGFALSWLKERGYDVDRTEVEARVWKMDHVDNAMIELAEGAVVPIDAGGTN